MKLPEAKENTEEQNSFNPVITRREFIAGTTAIAAGLLLPQELLALGLKKGETFYQDMETYRRALAEQKTPILKALQAGLAAPSPHNLQQWLFQIINDNEALLYVDAGRLLPETDPPGRQVMVGQGAFLRMTEIGATLEKIRVENQLFPEGASQETVKGKKPVARITAVFDESLDEHPLAPAIPLRQTDRTPFKEEQVSAYRKQNLQNVADNFHSQLFLIDDQETVRKLRDWTKAAFAIETNTYAKHEESRIWFRYSDKEIYEKRDGISLRGNGIHGMKLTMARSFFLKPGEESWHSNANRRAGENLVAKAVDTTPLFAMIVTQQNNLRDQVLAGKDYVSFQLQAAALGLKMQPLSQILEEYSEMDPMRLELEKFTGTQKRGKVQMLLRVGEGSYRFSSPRRPLETRLI